MVKQLTFDRMYKALVEKDSTFEGLFIVGVKTTGIFCRPTCSARKPKKENVEFFPSQKDALAGGYRACKVCKPMKVVGEKPDWLSGLMKQVEEGRVKFRDYELREMGLSPSKIRRYFKQNHGMTFQAYLRMHRINGAFQKIKEGNKVTSTAFIQGDESLSGFSPGSEGQIITINRITTSLGPMMIGVTDAGLCLLEFTDRRMIETQIKILKKRLKSEMITGQHPMIDLVKIQLDEYFDGKRKDFELPLVTSGTDFQNKVWKELTTIPYGHTRSYKQQADAIGDVKAVRAVARANGENRLSIVIPCHRVIGSDGSIVGYGGGIPRKQWLLKHEFENG